MFKMQCGVEPSFLDVLKISQTRSPHVAALGPCTSAARARDQEIQLDRLSIPAPQIFATSCCFNTPNTARSNAFAAVRLVRQHVAARPCRRRASAMDLEKDDTSAQVAEQPPSSPLPAKDQTLETQSPAVAQSGATSIQQLTDRALEFLSSASNETIGACLVGLGASTYLVLGRVGLVLIGVVGGVVLHATWEGGSASSPDAQGRGEDKRRRETGLDVIHRVLKWRSQKGSDEEADEDDAPLKVDTFSLSERDLTFADFKPETAAALRHITDAVVKDYVKYVSLNRLDPYTDHLIGGGTLQSFRKSWHFLQLAETL